MKRLTLQETIDVLQDSRTMIRRLILLLQEETFAMQKMVDDTDEALTMEDYEANPLVRLYDAASLTADKITNTVQSMLDAEFDKELNAYLYKEQPTPSSKEDLDDTAGPTV